MGQSGIRAALQSLNPDLISAALYSDLVPIIPAATDPQTWDPREKGAAGGVTWKAVFWKGRLWSRDDESTVDHDGITCIGLLDGGHYLTNDIRFPGVVESRDLSTPPDPEAVDEEDRPLYGQCWRLPDDATGEWAGHEGTDAMWTARGWQYKAPQVSYFHYVRDEEIYEHFGASETWVDHLPFGITPASIKLSQMLWDRTVENRTTTTLPASWLKGAAWIVALTGLTGPFVGHAGHLAVAESSGSLAGGDDVTYYVPWVGLEVFDRGAGIPVRWKGAAWVSSAGGIIDFATTGVTTALLTGAGSIVGTTAYVYDPATRPTTSQKRREDPVTLPFAAKAPGNKLLIKVNAVAHGKETSGSTVLTPTTTLAIFRDTDTNAIAHAKLVQTSAAVADGAINFEFEVVASDVLPHTYKLAVTAGADGNFDLSVTKIAQRRISIMETPA